MRLYIFIEKISENILRKSAKVAGFKKKKKIMLLVFENITIVKAVALTMLQWINNISNNFQVSVTSQPLYFVLKQTKNT